jgi:hypothetical protein
MTNTLVAHSVFSFITGSLLIADPQYVLNAAIDPVLNQSERILGASLFSQGVVALLAARSARNLFPISFSFMLFHALSIVYYLASGFIVNIWVLCANVGLLTWFIQEYLDSPSKVDPTLITKGNIFKVALALHGFSELGAAVFSLVSAEQFYPHYIDASPYDQHALVLFSIALATQAAMAVALLIQSNFDDTQLLTYGIVAYHALVIVVALHLKVETIPAYIHSVIMFIIGVGIRTSAVKEFHIKAKYVE